MAAQYANKCYSNRTSLILKIVLTDAIDRVFDKHGLAGKRDIQPEENTKAGTEITPLTRVNSCLAFF